MQFTKCKDYQRFRIWLKHATTLDLCDYADWTRANAAELTVGFDQWLQHNKRDILPSEKADERSVYGRMQYTRSMRGRRP